MVLHAKSKSPDKNKKTLSKSDLGKIGNLEGVQEIMAHMKKGDWAPMMGAIMTLYKEVFGTKEEKEEIRLSRKKRKNTEIQKGTKKDLNKLSADVDETKEHDHEHEEEKPDDEIAPYKRGTKKPTISPKNTFKEQVTDIYKQEDTIFNLNNLREHFGRKYREFIIREDPITHAKPLTFLGKPIKGGINLMMVPFLKIAEKNIMDQNLDYAPRQKEILGFQDRNMSVRTDLNDPKTRVISKTIPSFHKYGLAFDMDKEANWPEKGRGDIPDEVVIAMAKAGFNLGLMGDKSAYYLVNDPMHFQLRFPPGSPAGQKIIQASPIGKKYWEAISPMLDGLKNVA